MLYGFNIKSTPPFLQCLSFTFDAEIQEYIKTPELLNC